MKTVLRAFFFAMVSFIFAGSIFAQQDFAIAPGADLAKLLKSGHSVISSRVEKTQDNWLILDTDVHTVSDIPIEKAEAVLSDLASHVQVFKGTFSKTSKVVINGKTAEGTNVTFTTTALGQDTVYTALAKEQNNLPESFGILITQINQEEKIRKVYAQWYAQVVKIDGKQYTYIRFHDSSEVNQASKMGLIKMGVDNAHKASLDQLVAGAKKL
ncbi:hypothetical protein AGMMS50212_16870 [Spirochaetia bacterium]|nr:hypothetical protein AGMMS50212_16870 [Spirochaetia bacterium]